MIVSFHSLDGKSGSHSIGKHNKHEINTPKIKCCKL